MGGNLFTALEVNPCHLIALYGSERVRKAISHVGHVNCNKYRLSDEVEIWVRSIQIPVVVDEQREFRAGWKYI